MLFFFTTMVEPSAVNLDRAVSVYGSARGSDWVRSSHGGKTGGRLLFQYGNAFLATGNNSTNCCYYYRRG